MVLNDGFEPQGGRRHIADPEPETGHRSEIAERTQGRAVDTLSATVKGRRRGARTVLILEPRFPRPVENHPGPEIEILPSHGPRGS